MGPRHAGVADDDHSAVVELLGRVPMADYQVVVRNEAGEPVVIKNSPILRDGTPMPTLYWLVGKREKEAVSRLEAAGAVKEAEQEIGIEVIAEAHGLYSREREALLPEGYEGPMPTGGVGGTRQGVKCLHAHYAWYLAGGNDPVGAWVADRLSIQSSA